MPDMQAAKTLNRLEISHKPWGWRVRSHNTNFIGRHVYEVFPTWREAMDYAHYKTHQITEAYSFYMLTVAPVDTIIKDRRDGTRWRKSNDDRWYTTWGVHVRARHHLNGNYIILSWGGKDI